MAVAKVQITGRIVLPSGAYAAGGTIRIRPNKPGVVYDGSDQYKFNGPMAVLIPRDGDIAFWIVPNSMIIPTDGYYIVEFALDNGLRWTEWWRVPNRTPIDIGDIVRVDGIISQNGFAGSIQEYIDQYGGDYGIDDGTPIGPIGPGGGDDFGR